MSHRGERVTLSVIGAGFGRTGTMSLKLALEQLGFGPCYHMREVLAHPEHDAVWHAATRREPIDWDALFSGYGSAVDWPVAAFWRELSRHYPGARFILSVREPRAWHASVLETIFTALSSTPDPDDPQACAHRAMTRELILERTFNGRMDDPEHAIEVYEHHIRTVRDALPADRLLVYETGSGWEPLCNFLRCPVPDEAYPRSNTREEFRRRHLQSPAREK
jgi:hypothetical protein